MNDDVEIILQTQQVNVTEPLVADYILPKATSSVLGGVKIGANVNVASDGTISIPVATSSSLGVVQAGSGITIENGVISASGEYTLPQATTTILGGVYVDDELDTSSVNPVQNGVVATTLNGISGDVSDLTTTVGSLDDAVDTLSGNVSTLSGTVGSMSSTVATNTSDIATNAGNINTINNTIGTMSTVMTQQGNSIDTLSGQVTDLNQDISVVYNYDDIDDQVWTAGSIDIRGKGFYAVLYIQLEGSLTIPASSSVTIFTLDSEYNPRFNAYGGADIVDGSISVQIDSTTGNINLVNNNTTSVNVGKINAGIPIIYGSV